MISWTIAEGMSLVFERGAMDGPLEADTCKRLHMLLDTLLLLRSTLLGFLAEEGRTTG